MAGIGPALVNARPAWLCLVRSATGYSEQNHEFVTSSPSSEPSRGGRAGTRFPLRPGATLLANLTPIWRLQGPRIHDVKLLTQLTVDFIRLPSAVDCWALQSKRTFIEVPLMPGVPSY